MTTEDNSMKGKAVEHLLIHELLKNDFDVYTPCVDRQGVDMIIKDRKGGYVDVQVKSRVLKSDDDYFSIKKFDVKRNFFIVCHDINENNYYVLSSKTFDKHAEEFVDGKHTKLKLTYSNLKRLNHYMNDRGLRLLQKALSHEDNRVF